MLKEILTLAALLVSMTAGAQRILADDIVQTGDIFADTDGKHINAHGGGILLYKGTYYWFGEHKSETTSSALVGITCYSSKDLKRWRNRGVALAVSDEKGSEIERGCIMERPKIGRASCRERV